VVGRVNLLPIFILSKLSAEMSNRISFLWHCDNRAILLEGLQSKWKCAVEFYLVGEGACKYILREMQDFYGNKTI
jgi:hypothetical protein